MAGAAACSCASEAYTKPPAPSAGAPDRPYGWGWALASWGTSPGGAGRRVCTVRAPSKLAPVLGKTCRGAGLYERIRPAPARSDTLPQRPAAACWVVCACAVRGHLLCGLCGAAGWPYLLQTATVALHCVVPATAREHQVKISKVGPPGGALRTILSIHNASCPRLAVASTHQPSTHSLLCGRGWMCYSELLLVEVQVERGLGLRKLGSSLVMIISTLRAGQHRERLCA